MKNLANCTPIEFLKQTNRIRKSVEKWLTDTQILEIRKNVPELMKINKDMPDEERVRIFTENKRLMEEASRTNLFKMLDAVLEEHPEETLELLALCCFFEPEDANNHTIEEYLDAFSDLIGNASVMGFFTSLAQWGQMNTSIASKVSE